MLRRDYHRIFDNCFIITKNKGLLLCGGANISKTVQDRNIVIMDSRIASLLMSLNDLVHSSLTSKID